MENHSPEIIQFLQENGFTKNSFAEILEPDDHNWIKNVEHPFLKNVVIEVQPENTVDVFCHEIYSEEEVLIASIPLTIPNIQKFLNYFTNPNI